MYLSRLILNPRNRQIQREIGERYELHRTIMSAFPANLPPEERILFRLEIVSDHKVPRLLVQSQTLPDWSSLNPNYLFPNPQEGLQIKPFDPHLRSGQQLCFRLLANPTARRKVPDKEQGQRQGLLGEEKQVEWLHRKGDENGFKVLEVQLSQSEILKSRVHRPEGKHSLSFLGVQFDGVLTVTDGEMLLQTLKNGIGSGKGFGFGLLSLARLSHVVS